MNLAFAKPVAVALLFSAAASVQAAPSADLANQQNELFAHATIERAWLTAVEVKKPLLVMFTSEHCLYCRKMLTETYGHPAVRQLLASDVETVLAQAEDYRALTKRLGIRGYPTTLLISPQGQVLDLMEGYVDPQQFAKRVTPLLAKQPTRLGDAKASPGEAHTVER